MTKSISNEWIERTSTIAAEHGVIPRWLGRPHRSGYKHLHEAILKTPERFAHVSPRFSKLRSVDDHIADAQRLASELGFLPSTWWLRKNGYSGLDHCIRKYPERFAHIPRQPPNSSANQ